MARTVSSTLVVPPHQTRALVEVCDTRNGNGWSPAALAVNTLYDHHRGTLICDARPGALFWSDTATTHRYRVPLQGDHGDEEAIDVWVYGATDSAGSCTVQSASTNTGDSNSVAVNSTTAQWWNLGQHTIGNSGSDGFDTVTFTITGTPTASPVIESIVAYYARERATLTPVTAGSLTYPDGFCPHDLDAFAGERTLSATRGRTMHDNLRVIYARTWPLISCSSAELPWSATTTRVWLSDVPPQTEPRMITARLYVYATVYKVSGTPSGTLTFTCDGTSTTASATSNVTQWFGPFDVSVAAPAEGIARPRLVSCALSASGDVTAVESVCGWWAGLTYGA